ncbi:MAG: alanine--tRNA ligase-related protein, partial [Gemmatimonadetes bacterium]|nr:alanine--tRNA ligase-related protein [Gemmatimonadota bacterium]
LEGQEQVFVGYKHLEVESQLLAMQLDGDQVGLVLARNPFYAEGGGQISDVGIVEGEGWEVEVKGVSKIGEEVAVFGTIDDATALEGIVATETTVCAKVDSVTRSDIQRNHTATHLLHASLRKALGNHVAQRGSLVAPDRLRFDFTHDHPMTDEECA